MTPAGHLLSGYLVGDWLGAGHDLRSRRIILATAVAAGVAPDGDVVFGLLGGYWGSGLHRSFSHSLLGALGFGLLAAALFRGRRRVLFAAGFLGALTHVWWDALNVWGVQLLWPVFWYLRVNLVHERDVWALAIVLLASILTWRERRRAAVVWLLIAIPAYLLTQTLWRHHARQLARTDLAGRRAGVYPTGQIRCGWIAVSAGASDLTVHCVPTPWAARLVPISRVPMRDDFFTRATRSSSAVREFLDKVAFSYAEEQPTPDGGALVIWRDLREAYEQGPGGVPTGLHVLLSRDGAILSERHQWWLKLW
jgi:membrane-bound metal-dependent hydrolase YbcI (DUF457 family)